MVIDALDDTKMNIFSNEESKMGVINLYSKVDIMLSECMCPKKEIYPKGTFS